MRLIIVPALAIAVGTAWAQQLSARDLNAFVTQAKAQITEQLKDPGSALFRGLYVARQAGTGELMLCGEVNAKNSYGGYAGFTDFISGGPMKYMGGQVDALMDEYCGSKVADVK